MAWNNIFRKAAPAPTPTDAPVKPQVVYLNNGTAAAVVQWGDKIAAQAAMRHPIVYRALDKLAGSVQQVRWLAEVDPNATASERNGKSTFVRDLQQLLDVPNSDMTAEQLRYWLTLNYAAYGRAPLLVSFKATDTRMPNGLYPLETAQTYAKQNQRGQVTRFEYGQGDEKETYPSRQAAGPGKRFVDQIWKPGLKGWQHSGDANTPMHAIGLPAEVITALMVRSIQTAKGHPNVRYLVTCSRTLTEPQKQALKQHLNEDHGPEGPDAGRVPILQNAGDITIHTLDNDLSDIHSKMPSDDMARLIFGAFGIPIALAGIGAADAAKFAGNFIDSRAAFWQDTVIPMYVSPLFMGLSRMICPPGVRIVPDLDTIPALLDGRLGSMERASKVTFLTNQEKRELFDYTGPGPAEPTAPTGAATTTGDDNAS